MHANISCYTVHTLSFSHTTIRPIPIHCYYNIVISTEHYRLRNYTYTLYILSTYKVLHRESCSLEFQYNSSCKKEHKCYFLSAQSTYKVEAVPHCCIVYWTIKGFNMTMNANPSYTRWLLLDLFRTRLSKPRVINIFTQQSISLCLATFPGQCTTLK